MNEHTHSIPVTDANHQHAVHTHEGTTGEQIPRTITDAEREPVQNDVSQPGIPDQPFSIGMGAGSEPERTAHPVITPTVGRKVWFFPNGCQFHSTPKDIDGVTPMDADVVFVWGDRMVNLTVKDHIGQVHAFTSVDFVQPGDDIYAPGTAYATWMPYQVATARAAA